MKNTEEMRAEYRREDLEKGVHGKHHTAFKKGSNSVLLTPKLAKFSRQTKSSMAQKSKHS